MAERQISEGEYGQIRDKALALRPVKKGRGGSIVLAKGIEGGAATRLLKPAFRPCPWPPSQGKEGSTARDVKAVLWASADKPRAQMDAAEYKHLVLGLIFLTYISDRFVEQQQNVLAMVSTGFGLLPGG